MTTLKQDLEFLCKLQNYEIQISNIEKEIYNIFSLIKEKNIQINNKEKDFRIMKTNFLNLNLTKKEKENELYNKEKVISKYSIELNNAKSNDIYKKIQSKIKDLQHDKSNLEEVILNMEYKLDYESKTIKETKNNICKFKEIINEEIKQLEKHIKFLKTEILKVNEYIKNCRSNISNTSLAEYDKRNNSKKNKRKSICIVERESCSCCGIILRPQIINQIKKYNKIVFCDNCSCILFKK
ncbi:MAG: hypothetical protein LBL53_02330 [Endomicrobium sp.]|jgi:predicted  nucleic acid-binding Zn-ribbon protein|nr:hypothetical protein [Endomicrobium sp.]